MSLTSSEEEYNRPIVETDSNDVSDNVWTKKKEELLLNWREHIITMTALHEEAGHRFKKRHYIIGLPTLLIPFIMSWIQGIFIAVDKLNNNERCIDNFYSTIINGVMWLLLSILSQIYTTYDLGTLSTLHYQFGARYYDLIIRIDFELSKNRIHRTNPDVFLTELRCKIDALRQSEPSF